MVMQFVEDLSDRQAGDAVRSRIDWKYALSLELSDPGFDASVLCEFRARLVGSGTGSALLDAMLARFKESGLLKAQASNARIPPMSWRPSAASTGWNWWARQCGQL